MLRDASRLFNDSRGDAERGPVFVYLLQFKKSDLLTCTVVDQTRLMSMFHKSDSKCLFFEQDRSDVSK